MSSLPADAPPGPVTVAPPDTGEVRLGATLVDLLDEAVARYPNPRAFNQKVEGEFRPLSNARFRERAEHLALGLGALGLEPGERVGFYTHSDLTFCLPDMACLLAGLVDVPIYLTHAEAAVVHILNETESRLLVCSDADLLGRIAPWLPKTKVEHVLLCDGRPDGAPPGVVVHPLEEVERAGAARHGADEAARLRAQLDPQDLATILYTSGTTGTPKGVMLSHENISSNGIAAITGLPGFRPGASGETAISFLPLSHIFARTLHYCLMWYGVSVYFSDPDDLREDLQTVRPTFFASVPRVLERAYERILAAGRELTGVKRLLFDWSLLLAQRHDVTRPPAGWESRQLRIADRLVYSKWRAALGGEIRQIIVGGAALRADLVNILGAAGIEVLQGYGLTETSPVIAYNRPGRNVPGTVGEPLAGVEVSLGPDGEILTRGPHVMKGYYRRPDKTREVLGDDGWLHTGDQGEIEDGFLRVTGRLKNLFKLSTGKYVMPQLLEDRLEAHGLIDTALVLGDGEKYCAALLFLNREIAEARAEADFDSPRLRELVLEAVREAHRDLPPWATVKRAVLSFAEISIDNGLLTPTLKVKRPVVRQTFARFEDCLFGRGLLEPGEGVLVELRE